MKINISLETEGRRPAGVDFSAFANDFSTEMDKCLAEYGGSLTGPKTSKIPKGAQGEAEIVRWILELAENPHLIEVGVRGLIFALNELVGAVKKPAQQAAQSDSEEKDTQGEGKQEDGFAVRIQALGRELELPATMALIKEFLLSLGEGS